MKKLGLILVLVNTLAIAGVLGLFVYTKMVFKRPAITEGQERAKIAKQAEAGGASDRSHAVMVSLDPLTVNLDAFTSDDGRPKTHFITLTLALELRGAGDQAKIEAAKPVIQDKIIQNLSKKKFDELNQVQGRYVFKSQVIDSANEYLKAPLVTEVYLIDFLLQ